MTSRNRIERAIVKLVLLEPEAFEAKVAELRRYGLPAQSMAAGARGSDVSIPVGPDGELKDVTDRWLRDQAAAFLRALGDVEVALRRLEAIQRQMLVPISPEKARQALLDEEQGTTRFECELGCGKVFKRSANQRLRSGRCSACYLWWIANGRPSGMTPPAVIAVRERRQASRT